MTSIDDMAAEIMEGLSEYAELADTAMKKAVRKTATAVKNEISAKAPVKSGRYKRSWTAKHTPLNYGSSMVLISVTAVLIQLVLRENIGFATILDAVITGNLTQLLNDYSPYPENHSIWLGIVLMLFGFLFISLGMYLYMSAEQGCGPKDGLLIAIGKRMPKIPIGVVEILLWAVVTLIGWMLGGSVGIGTVISTFGAGAVMQLFFDVIGFEPRKLHHKNLIGN